LERDLPKIKSLKSGMFGSRRSVAEHGACFRQYVGIIIHGKRYIYISAVRTGEPSPSWRSEPMILCDGGESAWARSTIQRPGIFRNSNSTAEFEAPASPSPLDRGAACRVHAAPDRPYRCINH
jgi:hypothetical protein